MRDFLLTESERAFRIELRDFLACELLTSAQAIEDDDWDAVRRVVRAVGEAGYLRLMFPDLYRGPLEHPGLTHATMVSEEAAYLNYAFETTTLRPDPMPRHRSALVYTSGTIGRPKGVMHSHGNDVAIAMNCVMEYGLSQRDTALHIAPLYHVGGMQAYFIPHVMVGATNVILTRYDALTTLETIQAERVTTLFKSGEIGQLLVRGPQTMLGYWNDPVETEKKIKDGWLYTGDLFSRDAEGFYDFRGRVDDMIVTGGENVYPREVEEVLYRCPSIQEAAVVGLPDTQWGNVVSAFVVKGSPDLTAETVEDFCRTNGELAGFKRPRRIFFLDALPINPSGKVLKHELVERASEEERA